MFSLNSVSLIGQISKFGVRLQKNGKATCAVKVIEQGRDDTEHVSFVPVEVWGKLGAPAASAMAPGAVVLVSGQVRPQKVEDRWTLIISTRELQLLDAAEEEAYAGS
jgi:single-stranded DNA-binding protein